MTNPNTISHEELLSRIRETVKKTRELVDESIRLLGQYTTEKARREWVYADVKCGANK